MELGESRVWFLRKPITYIKKKLFFSSVTSACSLAPPFHCRTHTSLIGTFAMSPIEHRCIIMSTSGTLKLRSPLSASSSASVLTLTSKLSRVQSQRVHQGKAPAAKSNNPDLIGGKNQLLWVVLWVAYSSLRQHMTHINTNINKQM